jgi:two-component system, cell cycle sensor histidine kinase DivJ
VSVNSVNWKAIAKTFRSVCRRWVNPAIRDEAELALQGGLFAFLFALPPLALVTTFLAMAGGSTPTGSSTALAIALPVLAASWLSLSASPQVRNCVIGSGGLMLVLACASSPVAVLAASLIAALHGLKRIFQKGADWKVWLVFAATALFAGSFLLAFQAVNFGPLALLSALPVILLAAVGSNWRGEFTAAVSKTGSEPDASACQTPQIVAIAEHAGSLLACVGTNGLVANAQGRATIEWLTPDAVQGRGLVESIHIADRPGFLAWIGGLMNNRIDEAIALRLSPPHSNAASEWVKCSFRKIHADDAGFLVSIVAENSAGILNPDANAVAVGSLGHELRTPLNAIVGFSEMMRDGFCGPLTSEKQVEYLDLIHRSSRHLLQVSNAMLDWSQLESRTRQLNAELFVPAESASLAISLVSADAQAKRVGLNFDPACGMDDFCGDERALTQILVNLLSNAIKFAPENGLIRLAVDIDNDCLKLSVADNGPGMNAVDQAKIGMPFFQPNKAGLDSSAGAGLGLSIVRELARLHGGSMQIESEPGSGTCVKVAFPALRPKRTNIADMRPAGPDESTRIIRIFEERGHATNRKTA